MIVLLDNYDSFVYNLDRYVREMGFETRVVRNDASSVSELLAMQPSHIIISPGPCTPVEAGVSTELVREAAAAIPVLGVCLGHQCIGAAFGAEIVRAARPLHGRTSKIHHDGEGVLAGVPDPFHATRYHSLVIDADSVPDDLRVDAISGEGEVMAVTHRSLPVYGVQFHPESAATEHGYRILANFLALPPAEWGYVHADLDRIGTAT